MSDISADIWREACCALSHISPFMGDEDESHGWFNWAVAPRKWLLDLAKSAGVQLWLCGHYHENCVATSTSGIEVVTTNSCGSVINWKHPPSTIATKEVRVPRFTPASHTLLSLTILAPFRCIRSSIYGMYGRPARHLRRLPQRNTLCARARIRIRHEWVELANVPEAIDDLFPAAGELKRQLSVRPHLEQIMALPTSSPKTSPKPRHTSGKCPAAATHRR